MKLDLVSLLIVGLLTGSTASAAAPPESSEITAPKDLQPCSSGDKVAILETRVAAKLGGDYLGCFRSHKTPVEYAFAMELPGQNYKLADLENMLSVVRQQWKDFDPFSKEFKDYTTQLNALIASNGSAAPPNLASIKPILVSIEQGSSNYYTVTSIRTYLIDVNGKHVTTTKVNSDALVLRGSKLVRLTIQRSISAPNDVAQVQGEISDWAQVTTKK